MVSQTTSELTIIIPAYNEEKRIRKTLVQYLEHFKQRAKILVVLNGCRDNTLGVVQEVQQQWSENLDYVNIKAAIGKGGAIIEGFKKDLKTRAVGFVDADGATTASEFDRLYSHLSGADGIIASRWISGAEVTGRKSWKRKSASVIFHWLVKILFFLPLKDTQCGAKIFQSQTIKEILPQLGKATNMLFDVDLLYLLQQARFKLKEVPTVWVDQKGSTVILSQDAWEMFITLLKLRWCYWRKK